MDFVAQTTEKTAIRYYYSQVHFDCISYTNANVPPPPPPPPSSLLLSPTLSHSLGHSPYTLRFQVYIYPGNHHSLIQSLARLVPS